MEDLLREWDCSDEIIKSFADNDITQDILHKLDDGFLKELVPSVGARIRLRENIRKYVAEQNQLLENPIIEIGLTSPSTSVASTFTICTNDSDGYSDSRSDLNPENNENNSLKPLLLSTDDLMSFDLQQLLQGPPTFDDFDLKSLLTHSPLGNGILNYYEKHKQLGDLHRKRLVEIIIRHLYQHIIKYRLKANEYDVIAKKITNLFPNEISSEYYCPSTRKSSSTPGSIYHQGKLVNKVRNIISRCEEATPLRKRKISQICDKENDELDKDEPQAKKIDLENDEDVLWLKVNHEPWSIVIEKWQNCYELRKKTRADTIQEFLANWPILADLRGDSLIEVDFQKIYPNSTVLLFQNWDKFFEKVLTLRKSNVKSAVILEQINNLENINANGKFCIQLQILPYLIPPKGRLVLPNKDIWKFSILEALEGLIIYVKNPGDIPQTIETVHARAAARHQRVQPYLLVQGNSLDNPTVCYIILDAIRYQFKCAQKAFDILFKSFHVLSAKYPPQSEYLWVLIQKTVYNIETKFDIVPAPIKPFLNILKD